MLHEGDEKVLYFVCVWIDYYVEWFPVPSSLLVLEPVDFFISEDYFLTLQSAMDFFNIVCEKFPDWHFAVFSHHEHDKNLIERW